MRIYTYKLFTYGSVASKTRSELFMCVLILYENYISFRTRKCVYIIIILNQKYIIAPVSGAPIKTTRAHGPSATNHHRHSYYIHIHTFNNTTCIRLAALSFRQLSR